MSFSSELKNELLELKVWDNKSQLEQKDQIARINLRESFIKSGFINDPNKDYHLEIAFKTKEKADKTLEILLEYKINAKITTKGNGYIIYLKEGEEISNFLALIGANNAVLRFEETRVMKDTRNNVNRLVNCETANLSKTVVASVMQIENIKYLKNMKQFEKLSVQLKEIAEIRLKNPDSSYEELAKILHIGKSGISHRLNKINEIANEFKNGDIK